MSKSKMIETLLAAYESAVQDGKGDQIQIWANRVATAFSGAGMIDEYKAWTETLNNNTSFCTNEYDIEPSYVLHAESLRGILLGILEKTKQTEPYEELFSMDIFEGTRNYLEKIAFQANGCYQQGWYDSCAVMVRRLIEILLIDCFEKYGLSSKIKDNNDDYIGLEALIGAFLAETTWHISRPVKKHLPQLRELKEIGDSAAHGRNVTPKPVMDRISKAVSSIFQELVEIAYFQ